MIPSMIVGFGSRELGMEFLRVIKSGEFARGHCQFSPTIMSETRANLGSLESWMTLSPKRACMGPNGS